VTAGASEGFSFGTPDTVPTAPTTAFSPTSPSGGESTASEPVAAPSDSYEPGDTGTDEPVGDSGPTDQAAGSGPGNFDTGPLNDSQPIALFDGIGALWGILALGGAGLLAAGLLRLADGALLTNAVACDLDREVR